MWTLSLMLSKMLLVRFVMILFGITAFGVHLNGLVRGADGTLGMWVARRARSKATGPGKLDQMVAGGWIYLARIAGVK